VLRSTREDGDAEDGLTLISAEAPDSRALRHHRDPDAAARDYERILT
jgi:hypothetical protein